MTALPPLWHNIDWDDLRHINQHASKIPAALDKLRTCSNHEAVEALRTLLVFRNPFGIDRGPLDTLPLIVGFLLEFLDQDGFRARQSMLRHMGTLLQKLRTRLERNIKQLSMHTVGHISAVFEQVYARMDTIGNCLYHPEAAVRDSTLRLLTHLQDDYPVIATLLCDAYYHESVSEVCKHMLDLLLKHTKYYVAGQFGGSILSRNRLNRDPSLQMVCWFAGAVLDYEAEFALKLKAAVIYLVAAHGEVSDVAVEVLVKQLSTQTTLRRTGWTQDLIAFFDHLRPEQRIVTLNASSPRMAHRLFLLYLRRMKLIDASTRMTLRRDHVIYGEGASKVTRARTHTATLELMASTDKIWHLHHNVTSYVWGLPDDRAAAWQAIAEHEKTQRGFRRR